MKKLDLSGNWMMSESGTEEWLKGTLPGCNYLDLMKNGKIPDPFWGMNEEKAKEIGEKDYEYRKTFAVKPDILAQDIVELEIAGLDTLAEVWLNGTKIAETDNAHRLYCFQVKKYLKEEDNLIQIYFKATIPYLRKKQKESPLTSINMGVKGISYIRKPQCHFGWDWGPVLPPAGISGAIRLNAYSAAKIKEVRIHQNHFVNRVDLAVHMELEPAIKTTEEELFLTYQLKGPDGRILEHNVPVTDNLAEFIISVSEPELWWSNGLGSQPLYELKLLLYHGGQPVDTWDKNIGLRTIKLDTAPDQWGNNFRFMVNGVPIFAKGADWIPSDSFVTRTGAKDLEFYIKSARDANMNMLRIWGGGYYESDLFYDLCDRYGILVWQDFGFACMPYPFYDKEFLNNVRQEVSDNICRLRHHASLALWSGNNEIEIIAGLWKKKRELYESGQNFFYNILPEWVREADTDTPYWPGSPSSGSQDHKPNALDRGDTHLWQVWHGMLPIESFRKYPTRFCSEFGMESLPSMRTIRSFTDKDDLTVFDPVMSAHQKSGGGNQKMLFYLLSKYRNPATLRDFIYLSGLIQSETVRCATEQWRRNMGRCNGALYWQYNDCWPVASWAGIDYGKQYKAVQYRAKYFNQMLCISADIFKNHVDIYAINEYPAAFSGKLKWELTGFNGNIIESGEEKVSLTGSEAKKIRKLEYKTILKDHNKNSVVLVLYLLKETEVLSKQICLLVPDKQAALPKPDMKYGISVDGNTATLTLKTNVFARYVYVDIDGITTPLSDNYFDIEGGKSYSITFKVPDSIKAEDLVKGIQVRSLIDVQAKGNILKDKLLRIAMRFYKDNIKAWILFKFI